MTILETERMIIKTNFIISNGILIFPKESSGEIDISNLKGGNVKDGGFECYDKKDQTIKICHIGLEPKTFRLELSYGIEEEVKGAYEGKKYMQEALRACIAWLFQITNVDQLYARLSKKTPTTDLEWKEFISDNKKSEHILQKLNFELLNIIVGKSEVWYNLTKNNYLNQMRNRNDELILIESIYKFTTNEFRKLSKFGQD